MLRSVNPDLLVLARASRGESQATVSEAADVTPGLVSKWENGIVEPPQDRLAAVAEFLRYPADLFYQPERVRGTDSICFHHRKRKTMPKRLLNQVEAAMHLAQVQTNRLLRDIEVEGSIEFLTLDPDEHGGPREVARAVRGYWRIPHGPIPNMVRLVESAGGVVLRRDFGSRKLDGMSSWGKDTPPLFFLNKLTPTDRTRWTIAHELGHLIMHGSATDGDPEEEADSFAQELLLPEDEVRSDLRRLSFATLPSLKSYWKVSMKALVTTADRLGALPKGKVKSLYVQYSRAGFNQGEPFDLEAEEPSIARDAINIHLSQHGYTVGELAQMVYLLPDEFCELYGVNRGRDQQRLRLLR